MDKPYKELDKQINARINPNLHRQLKEVSQTRDIILSTLIEKLLDIGLKHYLESDTAVDTSRYITRDDLTPIEDKLKKLASQIMDLANLAAQESDRRYKLQAQVNTLFKERNISREKVSPVESEVRNVANLEVEKYIIGTELNSKTMLEYMKANPDSKNARRDIERGLKAYPDEVWEPQAKGYWKRIK
jgi:hypothetical protein